MTSNTSISAEVSDEISIECVPNFSPILGIIEYFLSFSYLLPAILLHFLIIRCVLVTHKKRFKSSSFFIIFVTDSIASIILIFWDIVFVRVFLYISPLCPIVSPYFSTPSILIRLIYYTTSHARFAKCITQIFLVVNRMCCVLMPTSYSQVWTTLAPICVVLVGVIPFFGIWNVIISPRFYIIPALGGFAINYKKVVQWAALSLFQSIYILTAFGFTIICTSITLYKLFFLSERIKSAEKSLCYTSIFISMTFLLVAGTQLCYVFCLTCRMEDWLFVGQFLAFDTFNVGSAVIMVISNSQLRESIFHRGKSNDRVFQPSINSFTHNI